MSLVHYSDLNFLTSCVSCDFMIKIFGLFIFRTRQSLKKIRIFSEILDAHIFKEALNLKCPLHPHFLAADTIMYIIRPAKLACNLQAVCISMQMWGCKFSWELACSSFWPGTCSQWWDPCPLERWGHVCAGLEWWSNDSQDMSSLKIHHGYWRKKKRKGNNNLRI